MYELDLFRCKDDASRSDGGKSDSSTFSLKKNAFYAIIRSNRIGVLRDFKGCGKSICGVSLGVLRSQLSWAHPFGRLDRSAYDAWMINFHFDTDYDCKILFLRG